jgi:glutathione S-transferase
MATITVWGRKSSVNVQSVLWALDELSLDYVRHDAGFVYGVVDTPEFRAMNPNGLVPVLIDGEREPIFESAAIVRYLGAQYGAEPFWPQDPASRAQVDKWAEWAKLNFGAPFILTVFWKLVRTRADQINYETLQRSLDQVEAVLAHADAKLAKSRYIAGDEFSFADIMLGYALFRYFDIDVVRRAMPNLRRYYDLLGKRPAYQANVIYPYDELRV